MSKSMIAATLALLAFVPMTLAEDATAPDTKNTEAGDNIEPGKFFSPFPVKDYTGGGTWLTWPNATGDWGGLRNQLAKDGFTFEADLMNIFQGNTHGDVVGHGIAAAMLMATARGLLHSHCGETGSLAELLTHMNKHLAHDVGEESGRFMTMLLMTIDAKHREVRWASGGHDPPMAYDCQSGRFLDFEAGGIPLGIFGNTTYEEQAFHEVQIGQIYFAGTDGVWEMRNEADEEFGKERLKELVRQCAGLSAAEISEHLREELTRFRSGSMPDDDVTFVIVKVIESLDSVKK